MPLSASTGTMHLHTVCNNPIKEESYAHEPTVQERREASGEDEELGLHGEAQVEDLVEDRVEDLEPGPPVPLTPRQERRAAAIRQLKEADRASRR